MKPVALAVALSTVAGTAALAADLSPPAPPPIYTPAPVPYYNWTGFYVGANLGVGSQHGSFSDPSGNTFSATNSWKFLGGGQVGGNYEFNNGVVVGGEAMFDWAPNNSNTINTTFNGLGGTPAGAASVTVNNSWLTTVTGKLGYAWDRVLVYGKAGGAWVGSNNPTFIVGGTSFTSSTSNNNFGWTVGAGVEYAFYAGLSVRLEYDYIGLTNQTLTVPIGTAGFTATDQFTGNNRSIQLVLAGINYTFH